MRLARLTDRRFFLLWTIGLIAATRPGMAEFSQGLGDISGATREASAKLADAFRAFFEMDAALTRGQIEAAQGAQERTTASLQAAANQYEGARADTHTLKPIATDDQERGFIAYFEAEAPKHGLKLPISQMDLIQASSRIVREFQTAVRDADLPGLSTDVAALQRLANQCADAQKFLIAATTYLKG